MKGANTLALAGESARARRRIGSRLGLKGGGLGERRPLPFAGKFEKNS